MTGPFLRWHLLKGLISPNGEALGLLPVQVLVTPELELHLTLNSTSGVQKVIEAIGVLFGRFRGPFLNLVVQSTTRDTFFDFPAKGHLCNKPARYCIPLPVFQLGGEDSHPVP